MYQKFLSICSFNPLTTSVCMIIQNEAMMLALKNGHLDVIKTLRKVGATIPIEVSILKVRTIVSDRHENRREGHP